VKIFSAKELAERINKIRDVMADVNLDWNKRIDAVSDIVLMTEDAIGICAVSLADCVAAFCGLLGTRG
jgi:hypothetical protein